MIDSELVKLIVDGDKTAFREVFIQNRRIVINACYKFVNNKEIAEDLTQDVFVEVYRSISQFKGGSQLSTWIYRIAVTKSIDYLRAQKSQKRFALIKSLITNDDEENQIPDEKSMSPTKEMERADRLRIINMALNSLPENQRAAFTLSNVEDLRYKEIAEIMNTTISSVESLIHRAKKNLEKKLRKYYEKIF